METRPNDTAAPTSLDTLQQDRQGYFAKAGNINPYGLTKREYFATKAMQGWISALELSKIGNGDMENVIKLTAGYSTAFADALIKELNKEK